MAESLRDAIAAALPYENRVFAHRMPSGNFGRFHGKESVHMDGCVELVPVVLAEAAALKWFADWLRSGTAEAVQALRTKENEGG